MCSMTLNFSVGFAEVLFLEKGNEVIVFSYSW